MAHSFKFDIDPNLSGSNPKISENQINSENGSSSQLPSYTDYIITNAGRKVSDAEQISDEYERNTDIPGLLVIFNFTKITRRKPRLGTEKDVDKLKSCFQEIQYEIRETFHDLIKDEVIEKLKSIAAEDHSTRSSLIVVFLTHGEEDGNLLTTGGEKITSEEIWIYFSSENCPTLKCKPKAFIFQACKGESHTVFSIPSIKTDSSRIKPTEKIYVLPTEADILIAYSTIEGKVSYRDETDGSWYIQELCNNITSYASKDDFVSILTRTSKCIAYLYEALAPDEKRVYKQMPCFLSTLTKKFYLLKKYEENIDKNVASAILQQIKYLAEDIKDVKKKLNDINCATNIEDAKDDKNRKISIASDKTLTQGPKTPKPAWKP